MTRLVFLGSPPIAAASLRALVAAGHEVALVVSQRDRRRTRHHDLTPTAVKAAALELGLPVSARLADIPEAHAELGVVVAFGRIIPAEILVALPMVNVHLSLLPRWRGAAPVERAILAGDERSGATLMSLDPGLDTGPIYDQIPVPIGGAYAEELAEDLAALGTQRLIEHLASGPAGLGEPVAQRGEATYAEKLEPNDRHLDFARTAEQCQWVVRVGRAWTTLEGRRLIVHRAGVLARGGPPGPPGTIEGTVVACGEGALELTQVQPEGRGPLDATDWARGARLAPGSVLGAEAGPSPQERRPR